MLALLIHLFVGVAPASSSTEVHVNESRFSDVGVANATYGDVVIKTPEGQNVTVHATVKLNQEHQALLASAFDKATKARFEQLERTGQAFTREVAGVRQAVVMQQQLLAGPLQELVRTFEEVTGAVYKLEEEIANIAARQAATSAAEQARFEEERRGREKEAGELKALIARYQFQEAVERARRERWRTEGTLAAALMIQGGVPRKPMRSAGGAELRLTFDVWRIAGASDWNRSVSLTLGLDARFDRITRDRQWIGANQPGIGEARENVWAGSGLLGLASRWEHWLVHVDTELRLRTGYGWGARWSVGAAVSRHLWNSPLWLRVAADGTLRDQGLRVDDRAFDPFGASQPIVTSLAAPLVEVGVGFVFIWP
jgi:hypothetical protein